MANHTEPSLPKEASPRKHERKRYQIVDKTKPLIEQSLRVRLPNGEINSVNVFDFNLTSIVHQADPQKWLTVELDDGSWIHIKNLTPLYESDNFTEPSLRESQGMVVV